MDGLRTELQTDRQNTDGPLNYGHPRTASPAMPWPMHAMMHDRTAIQSFKNTDMNMHACITCMTMVLSTTQREDKSLLFVCLSVSK